MNILLTLPLLTGTFGISLPSWTEISSSSGAYSGGIFTEFLPIAWFQIGIAVGVIIILLLIEAFTGGFSMLWEKITNKNKFDK